MGTNRIFNPSLVSNIQNLTGVEFINRLLPNLITLAFIITAIAALIFLIAGGIKWITSGGDREALSKARGSVTAALIGFALVLSVYAVLRLIELFFGIQLLLIDISSLIL